MSTNEEEAVRMWEDRPRLAKGMIAVREYYHIKSTDRKRPKIDIKDPSAEFAMRHAVLWTKEGRAIMTTKIIEQLIDPIAASKEGAVS